MNALGKAMGCKDASNQERLAGLVPSLSHRVCKAYTFPPCTEQHWMAKPIWHHWFAMSSVPAPSNTAEHCWILYLAPEHISPLSRAKLSGIKEVLSQAACPEIWFGLQETFLSNPGDSNNGEITLLSSKICHKQKTCLQEAIFYAAPVPSLLLICFPVNKNTCYRRGHFGINGKAKCSINSVER